MATDIKRIVLDVDGVLADFHGALLAAHQSNGRMVGLTVPEAFPDWESWHEVGMTYQDWWEPATREDFWEAIPVLPWARELLGVCRDSKIETVAMSSINNEPAAAAGKVRWWAKKNSGLLPLILVPDTACKPLMLREGDLLVDDSEASCDRWRRSGGVAVMAPAPWNRMRHETRWSVVGMVEQALQRSVSDAHGD